MNKCEECSVFNCNACEYVGSDMTCSECTTAGDVFDSLYMTCATPPVVCIDNCITCTDNLSCDKCNIGFVYNTADVKCEMDSTCEANFFSSGTDCVACIENCVVCGNALSCS
jgi:hypothetical protein